MKLVYDSLLVFFGTLIAATLIAFGEPPDAASSEAAAATEAPLLGEPAMAVELK